MLKLKGKMFTAKELIDNIHDLEKLNSKAYFGIFFLRISTEIQYTAEQNFNFFTANAMADPVPVNEKHIIKILLYNNRDMYSIQMNMNEVLVFLKGGRYIILNKNDIEQEKVLEIE